MLSRNPNHLMRFLAKAAARSAILTTGSVVLLSAVAVFSSPARAACAPCLFGAYEAGLVILGGGAVIGGGLMLNEERPRLDYPETPLPRGEYGELKPDCTAPHIQFGEKCSKRSNERYPQARRYGEGGQPEYDYDFTDHGRPQDHPNPHRHPWIETQGGPKRGAAEPIPETDDIPWPEGYGPKGYGE